ncbi:uncharacterized protein B0I36DRAFT_395190 [Microdochium trichocladiopsis]|uniref:Cell wall protein n=1 Tax=Microdochium trichocladiopsis TaxID=1682393 RepID=A0A9P9BJT0_9PEZI|nr:uncharacterized protein B0I36DRAFT_395190 [Microdochium trichocladiopsis]KAH7018405.1 hypothetical protein B0I36DRAFT_395190 [Microdochium trichocladiopsis]
MKASTTLTLATIGALTHAQTLDVLPNPAASQLNAAASAYQAGIQSLNSWILSQQAGVTATGSAMNDAYVSIQSEAAAIGSSIQGELDGVVASVTQAAGTTGLPVTYITGGGGQASAVTAVINGITITGYGDLPTTSPTASVTSESSNPSAAMTNSTSIPAATSTPSSPTSSSVRATGAAMAVQTAALGARFLVAGAAVLAVAL